MVPIGTKAQSKPVKKEVLTKTFGGAAGTQDQTAPGGLPWDQQDGPDGNRSKNSPKRSLKVDRSQHTFGKDWKPRSCTDPETGQIEKKRRTQLSG